MTPRVAIVGSGLGGFVAYATLRHGGLEPAEIAVFGDEPDPAGAWRPRAAAIRQRFMRSEIVRLGKVVEHAGIARSQ